MKPILFSIGAWHVYAWGTCVAVAFLVAGALLARECARKNLPPDLAWSIVLYGVVGGLLGAHLLYVLHAPRWSLDALLTRGGFVWYGGLAGGVLATLIPIRHAGAGWRVVADSAAPSLAVGYAIGRLGCHLAGDGDWGTPTTLPWGVAYLHGIARWPHPPGVYVHPAPLYELAASVAIFGMLWRLRARPRPDGALFALYVLLASAERFAVEFVRTNPSVLLGLTEAQWTSVGLVVAALVAARALRLW